MKLYTDGNKTPKGVTCSYKIFYTTKSIEKTDILPIETTVPEAEYTGMLSGLTRISDEFNVSDISINIISDNQVMVNQINRKFECKKPTLRVLRSSVSDLLSKFKSFTVKWEPRSQNKAG